MISLSPGFEEKWEAYIYFDHYKMEVMPMRENWSYRRGDIYLADLNPFFGSEQGGVRPVLVLQNNVGNYFCPTLIVAPLTSRVGK